MTAPPSGKRRRVRASASQTKIAKSSPIVSVKNGRAARDHFEDRELFLDRELSLLRFQRRVLEEAQDPSNPLLDRIKFLAIVGSNLNEFFMVRVSGLMDQVDAGVTTSPDGLHTPAQLLDQLRGEVLKLMTEARECLTRELLPALAAKGVTVYPYMSLNAAQKKSVDAYFREIIFPILTPLAFDPGRPFPHISNLSLNLAITIQDKKKVQRFARLKIPDTISQLVPVQAPAAGQQGRSKEAPLGFVMIEEVIVANLETLFPGMKILEAHPFHVTRDADTEIQELEASDLLETVEESVRQRRFGNVVRLQVNDQMPDDVLRILLTNLEIESVDVYRMRNPLGISRMMDLYGIDRPDLKEVTFAPRIPRRLNPEERRGRHLRRHSPQRCAGTSSLRFLSAHHPVPSSGGG
ncbi:MAG: hypothetical protein U5J83_12820 [Bryobacterales bacterium]|nr:hypothetical protein [Bryobacterales bacterium]